jgi:hypothetical protein
MKKKLEILEISFFDFSLIDKYEMEEGEVRDLIYRYFRMDSGQFS